MATALTQLSSPSPGTVTQAIVTQTAHGFSVGQAVQRVSGLYQLSRANSLATCEVVGVVAAVIDVNTFAIVYAGYISGLSGLTDGQWYFLSADTAGLLTPAAPAAAGEVQLKVMVATSASEAIIQIGQSVLLNGAQTSKVLVNRASGTNQAITNGTTPKIQFNNEVADTNSNYDPVTNFRFTAALAGVYNAFAQIAFGATGFAITLILEKNGLEIARSISTVASGTEQYVALDQLVQLSNGDFLEWFVTHASGSSQNLLGATNKSYAGFFQLV